MQNHSKTMTVVSSGKYTPNIVSFAGGCSSLYWNTTFRTTAFGNNWWLLDLLLDKTLCLELVYLDHFLLVTINLVVSISASDCLWRLISKMRCIHFLPRCMECRRGIAMRKLSVCPSVYQTRALWQNERKICPYFYTVRKIIYTSFLRRRIVGGGRPFLPEILGQLSPVGAKSPIFSRYSLVATQP